MPIQTAIDSISNSQGSPFGFKNRIINGNMAITQGAAAATITPAVTSAYATNYPVDRFEVIVGAASKLTTAQSSTAATGFNFSTLITSSSSYTVGAAEVFAIRHKIEGFNTSDLAFGTVNAQKITLSFWVRSSVTGTFGGSIQNSAANRSYPFNYTINVIDTFEYKTITIPGATIGTWVTDNTGWAYLIFSLGDSLDKFNTFWNLMNIDNQIIKVPFSGNMFSNKFEIIQPDFDNIIRLFNTMLENNPSFKLLIDRLNSNEDNIVITDFMAEGKSLFTLFELFGHFGINVSKLTIHFITYTENIIEIITSEIANFNRKYPSLNIVINQPDHVGLNINITYTEVLDYYFSNADKISNSRCMPRYPYTSWENVPNDVYRKGTEDNYYLCNMHTFIFYLFHRCYYTQFILKKMYDTDPDLNDINKLEYIIKGFFNTYLNYNNDEGLRRKYLKYKLKYLKLKENK